MCGIAAYTGNDPKIKEQVEVEFEKMKYRGPDNTKIMDLETNGWLGFHRLKIIDTSSDGNQPFHRKDKYLVCNGEIYNHKMLRASLEDCWQFVSTSDCEVILPLIEKLGVKGTVEALDGEFAFVAFDKSKGKYCAGRDPMGIRPLFYSETKEGDYVFSSEMKVLHFLNTEVKAFPPGHFFDGERIQPYIDLGNVESYHSISEEIYVGIRERLEEAVKKRLEADVPLGFLLSGGLDSSLVCAIAARYSEKPLRTFAIGINEDPIDTKYAQIVAEHIGSDHTEVLFTKQDVFEVLEEVIFRLETWDITTIRASVGMYLLSKFIREHTDIRAILTGEVSDELFGYKYTDFAPSPEVFQSEAKKRVEELYMYDVLRADRCIAGASLEARVPFSDKDFVEYVMRISPEVKMNNTGVGKYLLRKSFDLDEYLPEEILWREKAAFSDAVGHSMVDYLKEYAEEQYSDEEFMNKVKAFEHGTPISKEALLYREIFDKYYKGREELIKGYWMPNQEWENCAVDDPSARVLPNYGKSGI